MSSSRKSLNVKFCFCHDYDALSVTPNCLTYRSAFWLSTGVVYVPLMSDTSPTPGTIYEIDSGFGEWKNALRCPVDQSPVLQRERQPIQVTKCRKEKVKLKAPQ